MDWYEDKGGNKRWMRNQTSSTYKDDDGTIWVRIGESATFTFGNEVIVFGQIIDKKGNQILFSNIFDICLEIEQSYNPKALKGAFAIGVMTSVADGPLPFGEAAAGAIVAGAMVYTLVDYEVYLFSKTARGNHRDDGLTGLSDQNIADALAGLAGGHLTAEQKALKKRLTTEQKVRNERNVQKRKNKKDSSTRQR